MSRFPLDKLKINKFRREIEPNEVLLDALSQNKEKEIGISEKKLEIPISQIILKVFWIGILLLFLIFFGRTFQLQIIDGKTFSELSENFIVYATTSQLVNTKGESLTGIKSRWLLCWEIVRISASALSKTNFASSFSEKASSVIFPEASISLRFR